MSDDIQISETQGKALKQFDEWFAVARRYYTGRRERFDKDGDYDDDSESLKVAGLVPQVFKIFGFAGSGKTTIAARKAQDLGSGVMAATFTGKAALVMRKKGFNCSTIHSLIYKPDMVPVLDDKGNPTGEETLDFVLNEESDLWNAKLLVVDEVSMVGEDLGRDLLSFNVPILVLGDPGQLPPISGAGFFTKSKPDVMLTEIHRQALDNPIIRMSMDVRLGRGVRTGSYGESRVITKAEFTRNRAAWLLGADQVLCGINRTRRTFNADMRKYMGFDLIAQPMINDKLICLKNSRKEGLFNGGMWRVSEAPVFDGEIFEMKLDSLDTSLKAKVKVPLEFFTGEEDKLPGAKRRKYHEFDFGYGITVHKAQGSQYDNVLVYNENYCFRETPLQHLYTAITRAAEKLTLVI